MCDVSCGVQLIHSLVQLGGVLRSYDIQLLMHALSQLLRCTKILIYSVNRS